MDSFFWFIGLVVAAYISFKILDAVFKPLIGKIGSYKKATEYYIRRGSNETGNYCDLIAMTSTHALSLRYYLPLQENEASTIEILRSLLNDPDRVNESAFIHNNFIAKHFTSLDKKINFQYSMLPFAYSVAYNNHIPLPDYIEECEVSYSCLPVEDGLIVDMTAKFINGSPEDKERRSDKVFYQQEKFIRRLTLATH